MGKSLTQVVIFGAGGHARDVLDVFEAANANQHKYNVLGFIVDPQYGQPGQIVNGKPILGGFDWLESHSSKVECICGVGAPEIRFDMIQRARTLGARFCTILHPTALITSRVEVGPGTIITAGCILTNQIRIGEHVHVNLDSTIAHDTILQDFVTISPGVHISGNVVVGKGSYIGTGTNIIERVHIGVWAVIGAGSTVIRDIPDNTTAVGSPAKVIKTRQDGWYRNVDKHSLGRD